ncbi:MAG: TonB-dependent receptor [Bacteroidota bacterium]|jgi:outer membrane receptor protein involved in Fe transport
MRTGRLSQTRIAAYSFAGTLLICLLHPEVFCQQPAAAPDTLPHFIMETVVITADRFQNKIAQTTSSASVVDSKEIQRLPVATLSDVLENVPGFFIFNTDGMGRNSIVSTRGFYGGGEADYILLQVDGKQVNDLESGLANWNLFPLNSIGTVEVSRGASSPLYGDAALGGVVNVITRTGDTTRTHASVEGGTYGLFNAGLGGRGMWGSNPYQLFVSDERTTGFRSHGNWQGGTVNGDISFQLTEFSKLWLSTLDQWTKSDDPGPLTQEELDASRTASSPYYKADGKDDKRYQLQADYSTTFSNGAELTGKVYYNRKDADDIGTYVTPAEIVKFVPAFTVIGLYDTSFYGDTKERELRSNEGGINIKYDYSSLISSMKNRLVVGFDGTSGRLQSTYYSQFSGFEENYLLQGFTRDTTVADGIAKRAKYAFYVNDEVRLIDRLALNIGARFDGQDDGYDGTFPHNMTFTANHTALSPKAGLNLQFAENENFSGSAYATINRSFKAPTLDQLADQRPITAGLFTPIGGGRYSFFTSDFPPFSNSMLRPQKGTSYEIGTYQRFKLHENLYSEMILSLYQMDMTDEIDFDLSTFKYLNIQQSRHQGAEIGLRVYSTPGLTVFANYTWSSVKFTSGHNDGNFLKAIPRNVFVAGASYEHGSGIRASMTWNFVNDMFLDDGNTAMLPNYSFGKVKFSYSIAPFTFSLAVDNMLNSRFSSTGYLLYDKIFLYPASERSFRGGLTVDF